MADKKPGFFKRLFKFGKKKEPEEEIAERTKEYEDRFANPFVAAEKGFIDDVIMPSQTRVRLCRAFAMLKGKSLENPWKKHDNLPL